MNPSHLPAAANANIVTHFTYVQSRIADMYVSTRGNLVLVDSGLPCDTFNVICGARLVPASAPEIIRTAIDYFTVVQRPFAWWHNPGDQPANLGDMLRVAGLHAAETELAMAADLTLLRVDDPIPPGLQIQRARTATHLRDFASIVAANWTPPDTHVTQFYELAAPVLLNPDSALWFYVGYLDDVPVAAAELTIGGGVVGLYSICTLEAYRGRGFGTALTLRPLLDAYDIGHHTAILQAAAGGVNIYKRVGFETFGDITEYKPML